MKYRINLRLFEDGAGSGAGQGAAGGNGSQGNAGGATGAQHTGNYTYEQLEEIASSRADKAERAALANFFRSQGMSEAEVTEAIKNFKAQKAASQPNVSQVEKERDDYKGKYEQMQNEKILTGKGVKAEDMHYVMFKVGQLVDDKTDFKKAAEKFLKENPRFTGQTYRVSTSTQSGGGESAGSGNDSINAAIRRAAGR